MGFLPSLSQNSNWDEKEWGMRVGVYVVVFYDYLYFYWYKSMLQKVRDLHLAG
jgi:hypothetical protein